MKNVGITTTIKNLLTSRTADIHWMTNAGWTFPGYDKKLPKTNFSFCVPLKLLLGFADDYNRILLNVKQELVLLRSATDNNAVYQIPAASHDFIITLNKVIWKVPYVNV